MCIIAYYLARVLNRSIALALVRALASALFLALGLAHAQVFYHRIIFVLLT